MVSGNSSLISEAFIQELLRRLDIVDVLRADLDLKKMGSNYVSCCPFHSEKTPSFTVSPAKQFYHCFGCGAHGTAIGFLMRYHGLSFRDAVSRLSSSVGLHLSSDSSSEQGGEQAALVSLLQRAVSFYGNQLKTTTDVLAYLTQRGLSAEIIQMFSLGWAPDSYQALRAVFREQYTDPSLQAVGLVMKHPKGFYDRFRGRVIFPIRSLSGQIIGLGGRISNGNKQPKYLNSPETILFQKGQQLYGFYENAAFIRKEKSVIVVEGYMDLLLLCQFGIRHVVASLGTACTTTHMEILFRATETIYYCFDGDEAGNRAAARVAENALFRLSDKNRIYFCSLPPGEDPDSYVRLYGADRFREFLQQSKPLSSFVMQLWLAQYPVDTVEGRVRFIQKVRPLLKRIQAPVFRMALMNELSQLSGVSEEQLALIPSESDGSSSDSAPRSYPQTACQSSVYEVKKSLKNQFFQGRRPVPSLAQRIARLLLSRPCCTVTFPYQYLDLSSSEFSALKDLLVCTETLPPHSTPEDLFRLLRDHPRSAWFEQVFSLSGHWDTEEAWAREFQEACLSLERNYLEKQCDLLLKKGALLTESEKMKVFDMIKRLQDLKVGLLS